MFLALALVLAAVPVPRSTAAVLPSGSRDADGRALGLVLQSRVAEVLRTSGAFNELHAKQMLSMAGHEAFDPASFGLDGAADADVAAYLGADVFASSRLEKTGKGWSLTGFAGARGKAPAAIKAIALPASVVAAVTQATGELAKRVAAAAERKGLDFGDLSPGTKSDEALVAYARCYAALVRQPMGIENPVVLDSDALTGAIADCRKALELDGDFRAARHALALALAIEGQDGDSARLIALDEEPDSAMWWIARFWLVTRYQSGERGEALLEDALVKRPGFLLAQVYLCEHLGVMQKFAAALSACEKAAAKTPKGVFPMLRVGKMLARQFRHEDAIAKTKQAIALQPKRLDSREAHLQLASRYVDASMLSEAIAQLEPLVKSDKVRGEELLRLGYAWELKGDAGKAMAHYERAIAKATSPGEWRTRGRAWYDIAVLQARGGNNGKAKDALAEAYKTGYRQSVMDPALKSIARELERGELSKAGGPDAGSGQAALIPKARELSLFPVDASGEIQTGKPAPKPPPDFIKVQF